MWLGEPTREVVEHYDPAGTLTGRSVITRPSPWTDEDRAWLLAHLVEQREACPGCGLPLDECRDPKSAGSWTPLVDTCQACVVAQAEMDNQTEGPRRRGVYVGVRRI
ncbi:hypothetical protein FJK98_02495 [Micromonospora sp. HM134]|uniref:hypothetical protein n=1 Tax=Micromonospora sp. HM134 TaxID=2583243 RepID=UPI0011988781|nr:hypothetical protein [Micromonospora sp. HM134]QDY06171.1 hypothetical protein FJK98_02495 [Micromonospora sp. HM134]